MERTDIIKILEGYIEELKGAPVVPEEEKDPEPGWPLDSLIATEVLHLSDQSPNIPNYSNNTNNAFEMISELDYPYFSVERESTSGIRYIAVCMPIQNSEEEINATSLHSAAHAICLCALKAKRYEKQQNQS